MGDKEHLKQEYDALVEAYQRHFDACQQYDTANREKTATLNALNEAQKAFDVAMDKFKGQHSARDSDWWRKKHDGRALQSQENSNE